MPIFRNDDRKIVLFIHIPKCAGTSIENQLIKDGWGYDWLIFPARDSVPNGVPCNPQHYHKDLIDKYLDRDVDLEFTIIRNPLHRLLSEFTWIGYRQEPKLKSDLQNYLEKNGQDASFMAMFDKWACSRMSDFIINETHYNTRQDLYFDKKMSFPFDNHMRPQHHFIRSTTEVFKIEEFENKLLPFLKKELNIHGLDKDNESSNEDKPLMYYGTDRFKELYSKLYFEDHDKFNYERPFK